MTKITAVSDRIARLAAVVLVAVAVLAVAAGSAGAMTLYNNIPKKAAALPAEGFECCEVKQFGGAVEFTKEPRHKNNITFSVIVGMDEYQCQKGSWYTEHQENPADDVECITPPGATFKWPITLRMYDLGPGNQVGELIAEETKEFEMPYRPSQNNTYCTGAGPEGEKGGWYDPKTHECYIDNFFPIEFTLPVAKLQQQAIISVAYDTTSYGEPPAGNKPCDEEKNGSATYDNCPYDSLNVGVNAIYKKVGPGEDYEAQPTSPSVGTDPFPEEVFANSGYSAVYCGQTSTPPLGVFGPTGVYASGPNAGKGCWKYEQPAIEVKRP